VHLSTLQSAVGPWLRIGEWSGANPYTPTNRTIGTQIGRRNGIAAAAPNLPASGLYSDNAYLRGMVRTPETVMNDDGLHFLYPTLAASSGPGSMRWWGNLGGADFARGATPAASHA